MTRDLKLQPNFDNLSDKGPYVGAARHGNQCASAIGDGDGTSFMILR